MNKWRIFLLVLGCTIVTFAQVPQLINYQGVLMDPETDQPVADATYSMSFSLYDVASGGSAIWTESKTVQTKDGLYDVLLGSITPLTPTIFSGSAKYLGIQVGSDPEMIPRKRIISVAYAIISSEVIGTSNVFPSDGNVGIGTPTPAAKFEVVGSGGTNLEIDSPLPARSYTTVRSSKYLSMESANAYGAFVTANAYFDGSRWQRGTTTYGASQIAILSGEQTGRIEFRTVGPGDNPITWPSTRVVIEEDGNVGIGMPSLNPQNILTIQQNSPTDPIADAWTIYSSKRWKTNVKPIDDALDKVNQLRGVCYDWTANGKHDIGLIAEEVGEVIPEVVAYEENGTDAISIDYARLVAVLIEANKELQKEIEQQQLTNKKQQTTINDLSVRILTLEMAKQNK